MRTALVHVAGQTRTCITHMSTRVQCVKHLSKEVRCDFAYPAPTALSVLLSGLSAALRSFEVFPAPSIAFRALANCTYWVTRDAQFMAAHGVCTSPRSASGTKQLSKSTALALESLEPSPCQLAERAGLDVRGKMKKGREREVEVKKCRRGAEQSWSLYQK